MSLLLIMLEGGHHYSALLGWNSSHILTPIHGNMMKICWYNVQGGAPLLSTTCMEFLSLWSFVPKGSSPISTPLLPNVSDSDSTSKSLAIEGELSVMHPWQIFRISRAKDWAGNFKISPKKWKFGNLSPLSSLRRARDWGGKSSRSCHISHRLQFSHQLGFLRRRLDLPDNSWQLLGSSWQLPPLVASWIFLTIPENCHNLSPGCYP